MTTYYHIVLRSTNPDPTDKEIGLVSFGLKYTGSDPDFDAGIWAMQQVHGDERFAGNTFTVETVQKSDKPFPTAEERADEWGVER